MQIKLRASIDWPISVSKLTMQIQWTQELKRSHGRKPEELYNENEFPEEFEGTGCDEFENKADVECLIAEILAI